jgi:SAM-dependent methyltransferase
VVGDERVSAAYERNAEFWIRVVRQRRDRYQVKLTDPALLAAIGAVDGRVVLDAGCGEGYLARELVRRGARHVHGVGSCAPLVAAARSHPEADAERMTFHHADVADLPLPDGSVDLVVANRLPNAITSPERRFHEFARVLAPTGRAVLLGMHPCFYLARGERDGAGTGFGVDDYFGVRTVEQRFDVDGQVSPAASVQTFYSLSDYLAMITGAGLVVTGLHEPHPTAAQRREDPWWDEHFTRPLFLLLECEPR